MEKYLTPPSSGLPGAMPGGSFQKMKEINMEKNQVKIPKITFNAFEIFGEEILEAELDQQEESVKSAWMDIYTNIASGKSKVAYWDDKPVIRPEYKSFMRYALHRSAKQDGFLQLSVMEIRNGDTIPISDSQHENVEDFISRRALGFGAEVVTIL